MTGISPTRQMELKQLVKNSKPGGSVEVKSPEELEFVKGRLDEMQAKQAAASKASDGSSADYYKLPRRCTQLQDLIAAKDMNAQMGEIFRAAYRYGVCPHSPKEREIKKILYYAKAELERLKKYESIDILNLDVEDL